MLPYLFVILQEKRKLQDETEAMSDRLSDEIESRKKMADKLSHERHQNQKEKEATQEVRQPVAVKYDYMRSREDTWCHKSRGLESPSFRLHRLVSFLPQLIEDLRKQLEHLQLYKLEAEAKRGRTPGAGLQEYQTRTREAELEQEIKRLKQVEDTI